MSVIRLNATMSTKLTIVLATANPHKLDELRDIFAACRCDANLIDLNAASEGRPLQEPAEIGTTFVQNAQIKATTYAAALGRICLADDSGLEIDALQGRPGVISSHYSTNGDTETGLTRAQLAQGSIERVLRELASTPMAERTARFVCCMCLADPKGNVLAESRGTMEGRIGVPPAVPVGVNGFGYDPLFLVAPEFTLTGAQLSPEQKNALSHRGHAARAMAAQLKVNGAP